MMSPFGFPMSERLQSPVTKAIDEKINEILARPEVLAEIAMVTEQAVNAELSQQVQKVVQERLTSFESGFKPTVKAAFDKWVLDNADQITAKVEEYAVKVMESPTIFQDAVKYHLSHYISGIANDAVLRASARQAKKATLVPKKKT